jgi:hypothetical protein
VDVGGTFTDLIVRDDRTGEVRVGKELSSPGAPEDGVLRAVEATVAAGGRFGRLPRWPFQLAHCFTRAARFVAGKGDAAAD